MTITESGSAAAEAELLDVVRLWRLAPSIHAGEVIDAATECLVAGSDTESLRELAGASSRDSRFVFDPLVFKTIEELGLSDALEPDLQLSAMLALTRRLKSGRMSPRRLASWAHTNISHDGGAECQPFLNFDDMYDAVEYVGSDEAELDAMVLQEADALLSGADSPGLSLTWPLLPDVERDRQVDRRPGWLRRLPHRLRRS